MSRRQRLAVVLAVSVALAGVVPAAASADARTAAPADVVPGSYIVVLKDAVHGTVVDRARTLASAHKGTVGNVYSSALRGFSVRMAESDARRLAADPAVDYVEPDRRVRASTTQLNPPSWGLDRIDQRRLPLDGTYVHTRQGGNVTVFVIDTGINISHRDFTGRARYGYDFVDGDTVADDCNGHGTHVAGTIGGDLHGVAKVVNLVAVRVLDCRGSGTIAGVVAGIDWVTANAPARAVANVSLGAAGVSPPLDDAIRNSIARGTSYVVAAGNDSGADACGVSPARVAEAITVGATTSTDARASFSNVGPCVDLFAPGEGITSTWHTSTTAVNTISGTSMAAPHAAGAVAWDLSTAMDVRTPQQLHNSLVWNATSRVVGDPGPGSPNLLLFNRPKG